jgi:hypothetical protein
MPTDDADFVDDLTPLDPLLPITPKTAVAKFLVDMRLLAERAWRPWNKVFTEALVECALPLQARRVILDLNPVEDYFFAGVVAQQAYRIRSLYPFSAAEALMRELALQLDGAVGRGDSTVSNLVFIILGRIRKARAAEDGRPFMDAARSPRGTDNRRDHYQAAEAILERIGVGANSATSGIMDSLAMRQRLAEPLAVLAEPLAVKTPLWWDTFGTIYAVDTPVLRPLPRRMEGGRNDGGRAEGWADRWRAAARAARPTTASPFSFGAWLKTMREPPERRPD